MKTRLMYSLSLIAASLAVAPASAGQLAYEGFYYTTDANLSGQNGGSGWGGAWSVGYPGEGWANNVRNNANNFSYPGYTAATTPALSSANYLNLAAGWGYVWDFNYAQRAVDISDGGPFQTAGLKTTNGYGYSVVGADGATLWGSFVYQAANNGTKMWLQQPTGPGTSTAAEFALPNLGDGVKGLILVRIVYAAGNDAVSFWHSPNLATWSAATPADASFSTDCGFANFIFVEAGHEIEGRIDDIRFGTTAADVIPTTTAPPAPVTLLATESFSSYPTDANLNGLGGGLGWGGTWSVGIPGAGYMNQVRDNANSFSYPDYTASSTPALSGQKYLNLAAGWGQGTFNYAARTLDLNLGGTFSAAGLVGANTYGYTVAGVSGKTLWGSFLYQAANNGTSVRLRQQSGPSSVLDAQFALPNISPDGTKGLVVFRIEYLSGNDNIQLWYSPSLASWNSLQPPSVAASGDYGVSTLILVEEGDGIEARFDDIRLGTRAEDVIPVIPPKGTVILLR